MSVGFSGGQFYRRRKLVFRWNGDIVNVPRRLSHSMMAACVISANSSRA